MKRNVLALLLALVMTLSLLPTAAMAEVPVITIMILDQPLVQDWETNKQTLKIEEELGVDLQFQMLPYDEKERLQKIEMMALDNGRDFADIVVAESNDATYVSTLQTFADMGLLVDLTDYMKDKTPYLDEALANTPAIPLSKEDYVRYLTSPDGHIYCFGKASHSVNNSVSNARIMLFDPWMQKLGLEYPTTTEELYNVLVAFRDQDPNGNGKKDEIPLMSSTNMSNQLLRNLMNPFIYTQDNYVMNVDGKLEFVAIQDAWKEGLAYIKKLVDEGLLSTLSFTQDNAQMTALMAAEETVIGGIARNSASNLPASDIRREQYYIVGALEGPTGIRQHTQTPIQPKPNAFISTNCKDVDAAVRVLDYLSSTEMGNWTRYGIEGENWVVLEQPGIGIYESIGYKGDIEEINNIWGTEQNTNWAQHGPTVMDGSTITYRTVYNPKEGNYNHSVPIGATIKRELDYVNTENDVYGMVFLPEEQEVINEFRSTIENAVKEAYTLFVVGERDLEKEWDAYVKSLYDMGLEPYMAAMQSCWDRTIGK